MRPEQHQGGFALVAALFLMIVIALLVAAMSRLSTDQHSGSSLTIQQARAYQAARAGLEWDIARSLNSGTPSLAGTNLAEFAVTVTCQARGPYTEGARTLQIVLLTAEASNGLPGARFDYAFRRVQAQIEVSQP
jgi:MSHA biogenesis protein MshP